MATLKWTGDNIVSQTRDAIREGMKDAAELIVAQVREMISEPFPPPSQPGTPPHLRTGTLLAAIDYWELPKELEVLIGANVTAEYWSHLEYGTVKMDPRPFVSVAVAVYTPIIPQLIRARMT
jgi:hypothetical protein